MYEHGLMAKVAQLYMHLFVVPTWRKATIVIGKEWSCLDMEFLVFSSSDIGKPKAEVAARFVNNRVPGCNVTPHYKRIQDYDEDFYAGFQIIVCGLDSILARR